MTRNAAALLAILGLSAPAFAADPLVSALQEAGAQLRQAQAETRAAASERAISWAISSVQELTDGPKLSARTLEKGIEGFGGKTASTPWEPAEGTKEHFLRSLQAGRPSGSGVKDEDLDQPPRAPTQTPARVAQDAGPAEGTRGHFLRQQEASQSREFSDGVKDAFLQNEGNAPFRQDPVATHGSLEALVEQAAYFSAAMTHLGEDLKRMWWDKEFSPQADQLEILKGKVGALAAATDKLVAQAAGAPLERSGSQTQARKLRSLLGEAAQEAALMQQELLPHISK